MSRSKQGRLFSGSHALVTPRSHGRNGPTPRIADNAESFNAKGNGEFAQGKLERAKVSYLLALAHDPSYTDAHFNLGNVHYAQKEYAEALGSYRRALKTGKPQADLYNSLGVTYLALHDVISAKTCLLQAIELDAQFPDAFYNLGNALTKEREYTLALRCFKSALALRSDYAQALYNLGATQHKLGDLRAAVETYRRTLRLKPDDREVRNNLADALTLQGDRDGLALFEKLIAEQPSSADAHFNASTAFLLHGDYTRGWEEYEWRWKSARFASMKRHFPFPVWRGESLDGSSILVYAEQGFGDTIQFARYLPLLASLGARVYFQVQPALKRLMATIPGVVRCFSDDEPVPNASYHCALMSLPCLFKTTLQSIPQPLRFRPRLDRPTSASTSDSDRHVRIGLVWAGNPEHQYDHLRSLPLANFLPLTKVDHVDFVSLQKGPAAIKATQVLFPNGILHACAEAADFADTVEIIEQLDLVVAVDTAVAHLAATMGKPVWLLLRCIPEWRWGLSSSTSPWYPTLTLFRNPFGTDWQILMNSLSSELAAFVASFRESTKAAHLRIRTNCEVP